MCVDCPVLDISEEQWQVDARPTDATPLYTSEHFKDAIFGAVDAEALVEDETPGEGPEYAEARAMQRVHTSVLAIMPDDLVEDATFHPGEDGEVVIVGDERIDASDPEKPALNTTIMGEKEFPQSARAFLTCIRRNREAVCMGGISANFATSPARNDIPPQILQDVSLAIGVLRTLIDHGSLDDMRAKLRELASIDDQTPATKEIASMDEIDLRFALRSVADYLEERQSRQEDS